MTRAATPRRTPRPVDPAAARDPPRRARRCSWPACSSSPRCSSADPTTRPRSRTAAPSRSSSPTACARARTTSPDGPALRVDGRARATATTTTRSSPSAAATAPRPRDYDSSFWDRVLAEGKGFVEYGPPQSLVDQMRAADFTPDGVRRAQRVAAGVRRAGPARARRDGPRRRPHRARASTTTYAADVAPEYQRLVDDAYLAEKGVIMGADRRLHRPRRAAHARPTSSRSATTAAGCSPSRSPSSRSSCCVGVGAPRRHQAARAPPARPSSSAPPGGSPTATTPSEPRSRASPSSSGSPAPSTRWPPRSRPTSRAREHAEQVAVEARRAGRGRQPGASRRSSPRCRTRSARR